MLERRANHSSELIVSGKNKSIFINGNFLKHEHQASKIQGFDFSYAHSKPLGNYVDNVRDTVMVSDYPLFVMNSSQVRYASIKAITAPAHKENFGGTVDGAYNHFERMPGKRSVPFLDEHILLANDQLSTTTARGTSMPIQMELAQRAEPDTLDQRFGEEQREEEEQIEELRELFLRQSTVLLGPGDFEFDVSLSYRRDQFRGVAPTFLGPDFRGLPDEQRTREIGLIPTLRYGIVDRLEGFVSVPFVWAENERIIAGTKFENEKFDLDDMQFGLKFLMVQEGPEWPDIIASITVSAPTGDEPNPADLSFVPETLPIGTGRWSVSGGLTFVRSFDPAVVFGSIGYSHLFDTTLSNIEVSGGDLISYGFGAGFAINNQISLSGQFLGAFQMARQLNGSEIPGSDQEPMALRSSLTYRMNNDQFLEPAVTFGLNDDATDVILQLSYVKKF
jgi:hypothetical protein